MTLRVIGAGFGRTGTDSMREALNYLGFGPCHHMHEVIDDDEQQRIWRAVAHGETPDWDLLFKGFHSAVDWPSAYYWRELAEYYPDAKIILTVRSTESWVASMDKTILVNLRNGPDPRSIGKELIGRRTFNGRFDDLDYVASVYEENIAEVQGTIPSDRLLTYAIGDGWEPLCEFLDVPVPEVDFPRRNSTVEFNDKDKRRKRAAERAS